MAEDLPEEDSFGQGSYIKIAPFALFFLGLFLLSLGAGLFFFKNSKQSDIEIIQNEDGSRSEVIVHVDGAVNNPGVYKVGGEGRVSDAVSAAGGLTADADTKRLSLAAKLTDGQKLYIAKTGEAVQGASTVGAASTGTTNINTASEAELDKLPGIGSVTAQKIISSRPYSDPGELLSRKVVSSSVYEKIKDLITVY